MGSLTLALAGLGVTLLLLAGLALSYALSLRQRTGLPQGEIIYSDAGTWFAQQEMLYDEGLKLCGKPDYLIQQEDGAVIPVELKSSRAPQMPYESHIMQVAVYCALVERNYGQRPSHALIRYADRTFAVEYTAELEEDLLDVLADMREDLYGRDVPRSHDDWARCAACGVRGACSDRLG